MSLTTILVIVLIIILIGGFPGVGPNHEMGYYPSGGAGLILLIILILVLAGRL